MKPTKILVAEKDPVSRYLYRTGLRESADFHNRLVDVRETNSSEEVIEEGLKGDYSIMIIGYNLEGEYNGLQAIEKIREKNKKVSIYFVSSLIPLLKSHISKDKIDAIYIPLSNATRQTMDDVLMEGRRNRNV